MKLSICIGCGCDDEHACTGCGMLEDESCSWLEVDRKRGVGVCSNCPDELALWKKRDRNPSQRALIAWAIAHIEELNESLRECHAMPKTQGIQPPEVRDRYEHVKRWIKAARANSAAHGDYYGR